MPTAHFTSANARPKKGRGKKPRAKPSAQQPPQDTTNAPEQVGWGNDGWVQGRIDKLRDTIPFWLKNVDAANNEREMDKMEEFLNRIYADEDRWNEEWANDQPAAEGWPEANVWVSPRSEHNTWGIRGDNAGVHNSWAPQASAAWGIRGDGAGDSWGPQAIAAWGVPEAAQGSNPWEPKSDPTAWGETVDDHDSFIDKAARFGNANTTKKKAMRQFYSLPAHEKAQKFQELVEYLRNHP